MWSRIRWSGWRLKDGGDRGDKVGPSTGSGRTGMGGSGRTVKPLLRADKERGVIRLDERTTLRGVPRTHGGTCWGTGRRWSGCLTSTRRRSRGTRLSGNGSIRTGSRITRKQVIDLLRRVCTVSVRTMDVVDDMAIWEDDGNLLVFGDRDKFEMAMVSMAQSAERDK